MPRRSSLVDRRPGRVPSSARQVALEAGSGRSPLLLCVGFPADRLASRYAVALDPYACSARADAYRDLLLPRSGALRSTLSHCETARRAGGSSAEICEG